MSNKVMRERRDRKGIGFAPKDWLHRTYRSFPLLIFFLHIATTASAENNMIQFKTLLGRLLVGSSVTEGTFEGQPVLNVAVQNDSVCDYAELLLDIKFITSKSTDGEPKTTVAAFIARPLGAGKSVTAISYFPTVSGGPWKVEKIIDINGSCPKEDAEREKIKEAQQEDKRRKLSEIRKKYKTIGFKGLNLGMTRDDLNLLMEDNAFLWKLSFGSGIHEDTILLKCYSCNIGCEGKGGAESCYEIDYGYIEFYKNKIIRIGIQSPSYNANNIDPYLLDWARFAKNGLSKKYGNPTRSPLPVERINIFSFKEHYYVPMHVWAKGSSEISVNLTNSEYKYYVDILYDDNIGIQGKRNEKKKSMKTEF
jgi:hypothetical protein